MTSAVRSACFEMRYAWSVPAAVTALDMAAYDDLVTVAAVADWAQSHPSYTGIDRCRQAVRLGNENAWSPMEVRTRCCWVREAGLAPPLTNAPVFDLHGHRILTPDLFDPGSGVAGEYDGEVHATLGGRIRDRDRADVYRAHGLDCVTVLAGDLRDPSALTRRLVAAYARAAQRTGPRTWTVDQPPWWKDTSTVASRRALEGVDRGMWLAYRRR